MTKIIRDNKMDINEIKTIISLGGVIAFPTDTVYGLACDFFNIDAISRIYEIKGRPHNMPLIAMIPRALDIHKVAVNASADVEELANTFWPGALTMILTAKPILPKLAIAHGTTIGVRIPNHALALEILNSCNPLATTSANPSGWPAPDNVGDVIEHLDGRVDIIIDGGLTSSGIASTVLDCTKQPFNILREGTVTHNDIFHALKNGKKDCCDEYDEENYMVID